MDRAAKEKVVSDLTSKFNESNFFILILSFNLSIYLLKRSICSIFNLRLW